MNRVKKPAHYLKWIIIPRWIYFFHQRSACRLRYDLFWWCDGRYLFLDKKKNIFLLHSQVAGVQINANGYSWLQSVTVNHKVKFLPLSKKDDHVECQVLLLNASPQNVSEIFGVKFRVRMYFGMQFALLLYQSLIRFTNLHS